MERFVKGDIVVTPFPFSDLTSTIRRPALIVADLEGDDAILCQITTKNRPDTYKVILNKKDVKSGSLKINSFVRPSRLLTIRKSLILYKLGSINETKIKETEGKLRELFSK